MELLFSALGVLPLLVIVLIVFALASVGGRREPDPTGRRPFAVYLVSVCFVALIVLVATLTVVVTYLGQLPLGGSDGDGAAAIQTGLVALIAALVLLFHAQRLKGLLAEATPSENAARTTYLVYLYAVCFVTILAGLTAAAVALFALLRVIAPGVFGGGDLFARNKGLRQLVPTGFLTVASALIFAFHWRRAAAVRIAPETTLPPEAAPPV